MSTGMVFNFQSNGKYFFRNLLKFSSSGLFQKAFEIIIVQDHKKRHCFKLWIQILIKPLLLQLLITHEGTCDLVPISRFRNLGL